MLQKLDDIYYLKICDKCNKEDKYLIKSSYKNNKKLNKHLCSSCRQIGSLNPMYNKAAWNRGLSAQTNDSIRKGIESMKKTKKENPKAAWNKGLTIQTNDVVKKYVESMKKTKKENKTGSLYYYKNKYGEEEGTKIFNEYCRKKSMSKESLIDRFGKEEGLKRFNKYWLNKKESKVCYSKISQELFWAVYNNLDNKENIYFAELNKEYGLLGDKYYFYDLVDTKKKIALEFNGDIWHANPNIYNKDSIVFWYNNTKAADIWKEDENKISFLKERNFDVYILWESDYYNNKDLCIDICTKLFKEGVLNETYLSENTGKEILQKR